MTYTGFYLAKTGAALSLVIYPQGLRNNVEIFLIIVYSYKYTVTAMSSDGNKINNIMINITAIKRTMKDPNNVYKIATDSISTLEYGKTRL
jgi:hypothetical protein